MLIRKYISIFFTYDYNSNMLFKYFFFDTILPKIKFFSRTSIKGPELILSDSIGFRGSSHAHHFQMDNRPTSKYSTAQRSFLFRRRRRRQRR